MKLSRISIGGFRNLADTTVELHGITAFVSPNNYGKSNLLVAIKFAVDFIYASPKERLNMMGYINGIPLIPSLANKDFSFEVEFDDPSLGEYRFVRYGFAFSWIKDSDEGRRIIDERIEINSKQGGLWTTYLRRAEGKYRKSHNTRSFRTIILEDTQLAIDILTAIEHIDINPAIRKIKEVTFNICDSLDPASRFSALPFEFLSGQEDDSSISFDDDDLPRSLYRLKNKTPSKYEDFQNAIGILFPEFRGISVEAYQIKPEEYDQLKFINAEDDQENQQQVPFHIKDEMYKVLVISDHLNQAVDISRMSTGTKRIIWLVANVIIAGSLETSCIGVEEIETSIHPRMIKDILEILHENMNSTSILLSSHSPFLIQYLKPENIYIGAPNENGIACFKKLKRDTIGNMISDAYDRGFGFGEYLFELMSAEGDEVDILNSYLED